MGPYQRTPKSGDKAIRYSGLGVRSVGPVGDFLDSETFQTVLISLFAVAHILLQMARF